MTINNSIDSLSPVFRKKFDPRWSEVKSKYPNAHVFEGRRTKERQEWLYAQWRTRPWKIITWTLASKHIDWLAVDVVFLDQNGTPKRQWPYDNLISMAWKYWIKNLKPAETCHFEDNWSPFIPNEKQMTEEQKKMLIIALMNLNSTLHQVIQTKEIKEALENVNRLFRLNGFENK